MIINMNWKDKKTDNIFRNKEFFNIKNPNTRNKTREYLSDDKSWEVLVELGRSSFTGIRTLKKLVQKDDYLVVRSAKENPKYK